MNTSHESTYALLVRSEEKGRTALGTVVYTLLFLSVVLSIWQFAQQPVNVPAAGLQCIACETRHASTHPHI
jgi:hypothetical protein